MTPSVVLVRPWSDAHGGGCCGGDPHGGICLEGAVDTPREHGADTGVVAHTYLRLREEVPDADVQIVSAANTAYLLPRVFGAVRRRRGLLAALREANRATTAGSVLVDSERLGDLAELGADRVVAEVRRRSAAARG